MKRSSVRQPRPEARKGDSAPRGRALRAASKPQRSPSSPRRAASIPEEAWEVFDLDDIAGDDLPDRRDFWLEPDDEDDA